MDQLDLVALQAIVIAMLAKQGKEGASEIQEIARAIVGDDVEKRARIAHVVNTAYGTPAPG